MSQQDTFETGYVFLYSAVIMCNSVFVNSHNNKHPVISSRPMAGAESSDEVVPSLAVLKLQCSVSMHVQTSTLKISLAGHDRP